MTTFDSFTLSLVANDDFVLHFRYLLSIFLLNVASYSYVLIKFYKVICYSRLTFEWLPMINPYVWPFSFFQLLTNPYFAFWSKLLPMIKFQKSSLEISGIIALEALNAVLFFCVRYVNLLVLFLQDTEKTKLVSHLLEWKNPFC